MVVTNNDNFNMYTLLLSKSQSTIFRYLDNQQALGL